MRMLSSLQNRMFLASALLATLSIGAAVYFVSMRITSAVEAEIQRDLGEAASLVDQQRALLFDTFRLMAQLIADLPKFKAAVGTRDAPTVQPLASDYQRQLGADVFLVTDADGGVLAAVGEPSDFVARLENTPGVQRARAGEPTSDVWRHPRGLLQVVSVPITIGLESPELLGSLTVGYLLDEDRAAQFKALTGADIAFALGSDVRASTLGPASSDALRGLVGGTGASRLVIGGNEYEALLKPLRVSGGGDGPVRGIGPVALVLKSRTERMQTLSAIRRDLGALAFATVLLAVAVSYAVARTITRPLATITDHMRQVAATGDLTRKVVLSDRLGWDDDDARVVATAFNTLTDSIATFQREAAQRERLSSLGRMSTIIAHEIRNPLMIIKGALRQITRSHASPDDIRDSAADIEEEIQRLNRLVNEVLDFARPIRFERAATDLNGVCRAAVSAVTAAEPDPPVTVNLDPSLPSLITDGERLRTALVNLLTNARHAVTARNGNDGATAADTSSPVAIATDRLGPRRVAITVSDLGGGIALEDLPRVFDPYFTTRSTGTGLGLPIAKNIIEGLGGAIAVSSRVGRGTAIRIELGDAPAPHP
jgi:signal transduction histidine kinase